MPCTGRAPRLARDAKIGGGVGGWLTQLFRLPVAGRALAILWPTFFSFTRDRERLKGEGRIVPSTGEVAFDYEDATRGLEIAQMLKG